MYQVLQTSGDNLHNIWEYFQVVPLRLPKCLYTQT